MSETSYGTKVWPTGIRVKDDGRIFEITFDNGESYELTAELLRVESPSAEVKGHGPGQEKTVPGKRNVRIANVETVGNYAARIIFDDGHDTGLYSWSLLEGLGQNQATVWQQYLDKLKAENLSRD